MISPVIIIIVALAVVAFFAMTVLGIRYYTHMLQLSSYQFQGYFRFIRSNLIKVVIHLLLMCLAIALCAASTNTLIPVVVFMLICAALAFYYRPQEAKKKFVVTDRVKRMFITHAVLIIVMIIITLIAGGRGVVIVPSVYMGFLPFIIALANLINKPVELRINKWYIDDAKRILNENKNLRILGVTGSFGKTSVKYYLATLLSEGYRVLMTPESFNTPMGIVRTIRGELQPVHEIFICEMGARHLHDIKEITDIVHPDDGIVTSIGYQHLETFHSLDNIISTKYELLDAVEEKKSAGKGNGDHLKFVNGDNEIIRSHMNHKDAITYGLNEGNDYRATDIEVTSAGTSFTVTTPDGTTESFQMKLVGRHNVENVVGAIAVANSFGIELRKLKTAVRRLQSPPHRLELTRRGNVSILDDAYNSNPNGAKVALETLSMFQNNVKILVTPGMVELGAKEDEYNKEFGRQAADACDYIILVGENQTKAIKEGVVEKGFDSDKLFVVPDLSKATELMYSLDSGKERVILLENDLPDNYK